MKNMLSEKVLIGAAILCMVVSGIADAGQGQVKREIWFGASGQTVGDHEGTLDWLNAAGEPDEIDILTAIDYNNLYNDGDDTKSDYITRITGWIVPQVTGNYWFRIASDDQSCLWLSGDDTPLTMADAIPGDAVCRVDGYGGYRAWDSGNGGGEAVQKSGTIPLVAGQAYAFMTIMQEIGGGDHLTVAWGSNDAGVADYTVIGDDFISDTNPVRASIPSPANGIDNVKVEDVELSWVAPWALDDTSYTVYFGTIDVNDLNPTESNPEVVTDLDEPKFNVGDLETNTAYYWQVDCDAVDSNGVATINEGHQWSFTTTPDTPVIFGEPGNALVYPGETAVLDIDVYSAGGVPMSFEWYKAGEAGVISTDEDLEIADAQFANEGDYYCEVTNASGMVTTASASIATKRMVGHYAFEGNPDDSSPSANHAALIGVGAEEPVWADGVDGQCLRISSNGSPYAEVAAEDAGDFNLVHRITASGWIKSLGSPNPVNDGGYACLVGKHITTDDRPWLIRQNGNLNRITWKTQGNFDNYDDTAVFDNEWHLVTGTWDSETGIKNIYIDGELVNTITGRTGLGQTGDTSPLRIGYYYAGYVFVDTLIDDVRVYNYALDEYEVAQLWVDFNPGDEICVKKLPMDLTGDCKIDLADLAMFAQEWMLCNRNPATACPF